LSTPDPQGPILSRSEPALVASANPNEKNLLLSTEKKMPRIGTFLEDSEINFYDEYG